MIGILHLDYSIAVYKKQADSRKKALKEWDEKKNFIVVCIRNRLRFNKIVVCVFYAIKRL